MKRREVLSGVGALIGGGSAGYLLNDETDDKEKEYDCPPDKEKDDYDHEEEFIENIYDEATHLPDPIQNAKDHYENYRDSTGEHVHNIAVGWGNSETEDRYGDDQVFAQAADSSMIMYEDHKADLDDRYIAHKEYNTHLAGDYTEFRKFVEDGRRDELKEILSAGLAHIARVGINSESASRMSGVLEPARDDDQSAISAVHYTIHDSKDGRIDAHIDDEQALDLLGGARSGDIDDTYPVIQDYMEITLR